MFKAKALPNAPPAWLRRKIPLLVNSARSGGGTQPYGESRRFPLVLPSRKTTRSSSAVVLSALYFGIKWNFHKASSASWIPALGASFYVEFPTGDLHNGPGSGLIDYWL